MKRNLCCKYFAEIESKSIENFVYEATVLWTLYEVLFAKILTTILSLLAHAQQVEGGVGGDVLLLPRHGAAS